MKIVKVISYALIAVVLIGVIFGLVSFLDNGQSNYYVEYGNSQISQSQIGVELPKNAYSVFYPKSVFSVESAVPTDDYTVAIKLAKDYVLDMGFKVDGVSKNLYDDIDFSSAFLFTKKDGYFSIFVRDNYTIAEILQAVYPDKKVEVTDNLTLWETDCFQIEITFLLENKTVTISFH